MILKQQVGDGKVKLKKKHFGEIVNGPQIMIPKVLEIVRIN